MTTAILEKENKVEETTSPVKDIVTDKESKPMLDGKGEPIKAYLDKEDYVKIYVALVRCYKEEGKRIYLKLQGQTLLMKKLIAKLLEEKREQKEIEQQPILTNVA